MAYESTSVPVANSQQSIRKLVLKYGGTGIAFISQPPREGFEAVIPVEGKMYQIRIIATCVERENEKKQEQEARRVWRVLFYHLKAVYEASQSGVLEFRELILPFIVTHGNRTIAERILPQLDKAIASNVRLLPAKGETTE